MKFLKNNMYTIFAVALVMALSVISGDAFAQGNTVMSAATTKAVNVFRSVKTIVFVVGGFGLVGLAFQAIFGKVKWTWFAGLAVGLAVLAAAGSIIEYATGDMGGRTAEMGDTFNAGTTY